MLCLTGSRLVPMAAGWRCRCNLSLVSARCNTRRAGTTHTCFGLMITEYSALRTQ